RETGRSKISDCMSARELPPVIKTTNKNAQRTISLASGETSLMVKPGRDPDRARRLALRTDASIISPQPAREGVDLRSRACSTLWLQSCVGAVSSLLTVPLSRNRLNYRRVPCHAHEGLSPADRQAGLKETSPALQHLS